MFGVFNSRIAVKFALHIPCNGNHQIFKFTHRVHFVISCDYLIRTKQLMYEQFAGFLTCFDCKSIGAESFDDRVISIVCQDFQTVFHCALTAKQ